MNKTAKNIALIIFLLSFIGIIISYMLVEEYYFGAIITVAKKEVGLFAAIIEKTCSGENNFISCLAVAKSKYSTLFAIPLSVYGIFLYLIISIFSILMLYEKKNFIPALFLFWITLFASIFNLSLLGISVFLIKAVCPLCISTYMISFICFGLSIIYLVKTKKIRASLINENSYLKKYVIIFFSVILFSSCISYGANYTVKQKKEDYIFKEIWKRFSKEKKMNIDVSSYIESGFKDAPITIIEFSDLLCPHCAKTSHTIDEIMESNPHNIKVKFINFPLDSTCNYLASRVVHRGACKLAKASVCAAKYNKFDKYKKLVFQKKIDNPDFEPDSNTIKELAKSLDIDEIELEKCVYSPETLIGLQKQFAEAVKFNVRSTPTLYINGREYKYRLTKDIGKRLIKKILEGELN